MCKQPRQGNSCHLDLLLLSFLNVVHSILFLWVCSVLTPNSICQPHASLDPQQQRASMELKHVTSCTWLAAKAASIPGTTFFCFFSLWLLLMTGTKWFLSLGNPHRSGSLDLSSGPPWITEGETREGRDWSHPNFPVVSQTLSHV